MMEQPPPRAIWEMYPIATFTRQEKEYYNQVVEQSGGFDCGYIIPGFMQPGLLVPTLLDYIASEEKLDALNNLAKRAIFVFNQQKHTSYQFIKLARLNSRAVNILSTTTNRQVEATLHYMTIQAKEEDNARGPCYFKALVLNSIDGIQVEDCNFYNENINSVVKLVLKRQRYYRAWMGFDCGYVIPGFMQPGLLVPTLLDYIASEERLDALNNLAKRAIFVFNQQKHTSYQFIKLARLNSRAVNILSTTTNRQVEATLHYMTIQAKEEDKARGPCYFKALVLNSIDGIQVEDCNFYNENINSGPPFVFLK